MRLLIPLVLLTTAPTVFAQVTVPASVIARTGDPADTGRVGDAITGFIGGPSINASGRVVFIGSVATPDAGSGSAAIFTDRAGTLHAAALQGTPIAPTSADPTRLWGTFNTVTRVFIADNGRLTAISTGSPAYPGYHSAGDARAVFASDIGSVWSLIAANGRSLPSPLTGTIDATLTYAAVDALAGKTYFTLFSGLNCYIIGESATGLTLIDTYTSTAALTISIPILVADSNDVVYSGSSSRGVLRGVLGGISGLHINPDTTVQIQGIPGAYYISTNGSNATANINGHGQAVVAGTYRTSWTSPTPQDAYFKISGGVVSLLATRGQNIGLGTTVIGYPGGLWLNLADNGDALGRVNLEGPGTTNANNSAMILFPATGGTRVLARTGDPVPEMPGYTYASFPSNATTRPGDLVFEAAVSRGTDPARYAIFAVDNSGRVRLLLSDGYSSLVLPGGPVSITAHSGLQFSSGNNGMRRSVSETRLVATAVTHPAGQAVVLLSIPCPADIAATGALPGYDGVIDNNDFIVFIDWFFGADARADRGSVGGVPQPDGQFDNNDFVVYIDQFFNGCQ